MIKNNPTKEAIMEGKSFLIFFFLINDMDNKKNGNIREVSYIQNESKVSKKTKKTLYCFFILFNRNIFRHRKNKMIDVVPTIVDGQKKVEDLPGKVKMSKELKKASGLLLEIFLIKK